MVLYKDKTGVGDEKVIESPAWHEEILEDREKALAAGKATVSDWEDAKVRIKRNVSYK
ncbi:MAG: addiction module protein [Desulfobacteraceae bacterium]|nr:addiction module protein [Desulfobacteraceae bacterium]